MNEQQKLTEMEAAALKVTIMDVKEKAEHLKRLATKAAEEGDIRKLLEINTKVAKLTSELCKLIEIVQNLNENE